MAIDMVPFDGFLYHFSLKKVAGKYWGIQHFERHPSDTFCQTYHLVMTFT